ncbi:ABC transporter substrate-binding protein [Brevibacillus sp. HB1.3]|uniref:ABC transporter substrate-binding protein n=1 Tax=Brevibacillus sp. HB1.3 TaxID=2738842 RepID=UPI001552A235|nr:ABC transporter substrate-binding protein [Brevibacillus sp. HB1.3]NQF17659.1 ABC transporter substrate-binding protein [Brevibacillus sp. HB1.3]
MKKWGSVIVVGAILPVTGNYATDGKDMQNAIEMGVKKINDSGGVIGKKLRIEVADDGCDSKIATTAANSAKLPAQGYDTLFLINGLTPDQAQSAADYMAANQTKKVVLTHDNSTYAKKLDDFAKLSVEKSGGAIIAYEAINHGIDPYFV